MYYEHWLIEYKSSARASDIAKLYRIGQLYEKETGHHPKFFVITSFIEKADKTAKKLNVTIFTPSNINNENF